MYEWNESYDWNKNNNNNNNNNNLLSLQIGVNTFEPKFT